MAKDPKAHEFGGDWTDAKLRVLANYLHSYTTALKDTTFRKGYVDAFAGTGYRTSKRRGTATDDQSLFPDLVGAEPQALREGSARIALRTEPRFDAFVFIERSAKHRRALEALLTEFPERAKDVQIRAGDSNTEIRKLCAFDWTSHRAVLLLDPYGMQVEWTTIEAIASTKAIDMWLLFPLGIGVNRLVTRSGDIPEAWQRRLDLLLGTSSWREEFYRFDSVPDLFGGAEERVAKASMDVIGRYFNQRLAEVFAGVADPPGVLRNSSNCPMYLLCFAVGNPKGKAKEIALRIANHLLKELR